MPIALNLIFFLLFLLSSGCGTIFTSGASHVTTSAIDKRTYLGQWEDSILGKKLRLELMNAKDIPSNTISVIVFLKKAYLTGIVRNNKEAFQIFKICNKFGITDSDVISNLVVDETSFGRQSADALITTKIKTAYLADKELSTINIHVATVNGMAVLVGLVDTKEQWKRAKKIAINVGAKKVKNYILLVQKK